ncbi:helix-turn-helix domain-containing protein [Alicyclobacillus acidocaldarius]
MIVGTIVLVKCARRIFMSSFPERLSELLSATNSTKRALARAIGISERMIQYYITGAKSPTLDVLVAMADYFNVGLDYLAGRSDDPTPPPRSPSSGWDP